MPQKAGVQFSLPLIDFGIGNNLLAGGWGSVLITPDRLPAKRRILSGMLGFSSHYP